MGEVCRPGLRSAWAIAEDLLRAPRQGQYEIEGLWTAFGCCVEADAAGAGPGVATQGGYLKSIVTWAEALRAPAATFIEKGADPCCGGPRVRTGAPVAVTVPVTTEPACALMRLAVTVKRHEWAYRGGIGAAQ